MKFERRFSPITLTIETEQELRDLKDICRACSKHERGWSGFSSSLAEKAEVLLRDLGMVK